MAAPLNDLARQMKFELDRDKIDAGFAKKAHDADNLTRWGAAILQLSQMAYSTKVSEKLTKVAIKKLDKAVEMDPANHEALWWLGSAHTRLAFQTPDGDKANIDFDKALECFQKADQLCPGQNHYKKSLRLSADGHDRDWYMARYQNRGPYAVAKWIPNAEQIAAAKHELEKLTHQNAPSAKHEPEKGSHQNAPSAKHESELLKAAQTSARLHHVMQQIYGEVTAASSSAKEGISMKKKSDSKYQVYGWATLAVGLVAWIAIANSPSS